MGWVYSRKRREARIIEAVRHCLIDDLDGCRHQSRILPSKSIGGRRQSTWRTNEHPSSDEAPSEQSRYI